MIDADTKVTGKLNSDTANENVMNWLPNSRTPSLLETINCKERRMSATICEKISLGAAVLSPYHSLREGGYSGRHCYLLMCWFLTVK